MSIGELWIAHPLFPRIMMVLAWWVLCSTIIMGRNYVLIRRLERHNKLLQEMAAEGVRGVGNLAKQITVIQGRIPIPKPIGRTEERASEFCSEQSGVRTEEPEPAAIEEADEDGDEFAVAKNEAKERTGARST